MTFEGCCNNVRWGEAKGPECLFFSQKLHRKCDKE